MYYTLKLDQKLHVLIDGHLHESYLLNVPALVAR